MMRHAAALFAILITAHTLADEPATQPASQPAWPGKQSTWQGFTRYDFPTAGKNTIVVAPEKPAAGNPWIWRAQFWNNANNVDIALVKQGFTLVFLDEGDTLGCPDAMKRWQQLYELVTKEHGLSKKPAIEALSRGGLYAYNFAALHPDEIACIYGDNPVCNFLSWPAKFPGGEKEWEKLKTLYGFKSDDEAKASKMNPIEELEPLARARIPVLHVCADADKTVPYPDNSAIFKERYTKLGGPYEEIIKKGFDHHPHGLDDPAPIVNFILKHTAANQP